MCLLLFKWGPFVHSLGIVKWNSTRQDHPENAGGVSQSGLVNKGLLEHQIFVSRHTFFVSRHSRL